ncbi:hypothetical protein BJX63DRAFT_375805 [Aspergillus granulosus]|uniref:Secreted protein n=1 Tax=Aspergillus granulosus TaxID=176169 RepID=A0ABR4I569_9EURO
MIPVIVWISHATLRFAFGIERLALGCAVQSLPAVRGSPYLLRTCPTIRNFFFDFSLPCLSRIVSTKSLPTSRNFRCSRHERECWNVCHF